MKKILFPTDFSEASDNAFAYALHLADAIKAEIITLHVYEYPIIDSGYVDVPVYQAEVYQSLELHDFENYKTQIPVLRKIAETHGKEHIQISNVLLQGDLVGSVTEIVKEQNIDYVVMGTHGASGLKEVFLGSSTASIMTGTNAYVLGIPEESKYETIEKIGFTTQFNRQDFDALKNVLTIAKAFNARIECLYVKTPDNEVDEVIIADWKLLFKDEPVTFYTIESKEVEETIIDFIDTYQIDVLSLLNHRRGFWEGLFHTSLTKKLAFHVSIPLLVLHEN